MHLLCFLRLYKTVLSLGVLDLETVKAGGVQSATINSQMLILPLLLIYLLIWRTLFHCINIKIIFVIVTIVLSKWFKYGSSYVSRKVWKWVPCHLNYFLNTGFNFQVAFTHIPTNTSMLMILTLNVTSGPKSTELHYDHLTEKLSLKDHPLPLLTFKQKQVYTNTSLNKLITLCVRCYLEEL